MDLLIPCLQNINVAGNSTFQLLVKVPDRGLCRDRCFISFKHQVLNIFMPLFPVQLAHRAGFAKADMLLPVFFNREFFVIGKSIRNVMGCRFLSSGVLF